MESGKENERRGRDEENKSNMAAETRGKHTEEGQQSSKSPGKKDNR